MQEEIESRTVTLAINATKLTARVLRDAIRKLMAARKNHSRDSPQIPHGKMSVKQLAEQNVGLQNIEITDSNIKSFERVARKYGVDFALKKDATVTPPKYLVFFKARDADALTAAFTEFSAKTVKNRDVEKPSILAALQKFKELAKATIGKVKHRDKGEREL